MYASTNRITIIVALNSLLVSKNNVNSIIKKPIIYKVFLKLCFIMHTSIIICFSNNAEQEFTIVEIPRNQVMLLWNLEQIVYYNTKCASKYPSED